MQFKCFSIILFIFTSLFSMEVKALRYSSVKGHFINIEKENIPPARNNSIYPDDLMELAEVSTFTSTPIISTERPVLQRFVPKTKTVGLSQPLTQPFSLSKQLETLLNLSEKGERLPLKETINTAHLLGELYTELKSKTDERTFTGLQDFIILGERVVNAILAHSFQPRYLKEYVQLIHYLADIGDMVYKTPSDKMKLFSNYQSFHHHLEYLMKNHLVDSLEQSKYHHTCLKILRQALAVSQDPIEKKDLLHQIIMKGGWVLLLKRIIDSIEEVELLFNIYNQLYWLETDNKFKLTIVKNALSWSKILQKRRSDTLSDKIRSAIDLYTLQYEKWKKFEEEL
ncbi:MAG: hypothetical protein K0M45_03835 [Candidatus Paracaedibacteraceae bacterium]|nr:hypothetical protein [Candidatus Paracaedibacteraceae bacterium]